MARQGLLRIDQLAVQRDLEDPARRAHHLDLGVGERAAQLGRQTGGAWLVVSDDAEFDAEVHANLPS